ncbi:ATP-dependent nuclease [Maribacter aestuarii]|uniref:ATP-dependent nuclease n=1 Tax=Maribacter aestuarii TaxID=1130723 RepID=UPI0025A56481|nr:AAA family ATPase [Maribacter aestuarii]
MHITNLKLWNYRKYGSLAQFDLQKPNLNLGFTNGLNVLIGENDSGKTAIIDSIKTVLKTHSYEWIRIDEQDFFSGTNRFRIEIVFDGLSNNEAKNFTEWLGWYGEGEDAKPFLRLIYDVSKVNGRIINSDIKAGVDDEGYQLTFEAKEYLKSTYLKPLRDAKNELIPKKNSRLSQILQEHKAFSGDDNTHHLITIFQRFNNSIKEYFEGNDGEGNQLVADQNGKDLKDEIDKYLKSFYDSTKETEISVVKARLKQILEKLELLVKDEINIGLGTLNRLFMASELLHLNKQDWSGIRLGLIEELEAHLHPQAQMKVIESLQRQDKVQLILTTHSPNLASKVKLKDIILCSKNSAFPMGENYTMLSGDDYKFLERFLDVTKANLFFAKGVIIVEGWSEEILIPVLAKKMKSLGIIEKDLTEAGVSIVNVGSTALLRYSKIFERKEEPYIEIPISVITDLDLSHYSKDLSIDGDGKPNKDEKGRKIYNYNKLTDTIIVPLETVAIRELVEHYESQSIKAFITGNWTLEYNLYKSEGLKDVFIEVVKSIHSRTDWETDPEMELAKKLINKGLKKSEIAYQVAQKIEEDINLEEPQINFSETDSMQALLKAIVYACNN